MDFSSGNLKITVNMNRTGFEKDFPDLGIDPPSQTRVGTPAVWKVLLSEPSTVYTILSRISDPLPTERRSREVGKGSRMRDGKALITYFTGT